MSRDLRQATRFPHDLAQEVRPPDRKSPRESRALPSCRVFLYGTCVCVRAPFPHEKSPLRERAPCVPCGLLLGSCVCVNALCPMKGPGQRATLNFS
jgi:hypothetical protein